ncbi:MAG: YlxR family protein [Oscillospiraceae bacterium]|nr:YlxR family protein [Oscillospiraceae bacterium]
MQQKKIPVRRCVGCGEMKQKKELIRIVRTPEGEICADPTGKKSGRGAYICRSSDCLMKAEKGKKLERSFECRISQEIYSALSEEIANG